MSNARSFREFTLPAQSGRALARANRRERFPAFFGLRSDGHAILDQLRVAIIGAGAVGGRIALHLARLLIAQLWIVDPKRYKPESLLTQAIAPADCGKFKADTTARLCKSISPGTRVFASRSPVEVLDLNHFGGVDLIFMATDNLAAEIVSAQLALRVGKPLIHAAVYGPSLTAQVRCFATHQPNGACPACHFTRSEWEQLYRDMPFSCSPESAPASTPVETSPTASVSSLCSLAADLAVNQMLRRSLGLGASVDNSVIDYCGMTQQIVTSSLTQNPSCVCDHSSWRALSLARRLGDSTIGELVRTSGLGAWKKLTIEIGDLEWVDLAICARGHVQPVQRFVSKNVLTVGRCTRCRRSVRRQPFHSHRPAPGSLLRPFADAALRLLGVTQPASVIVRGVGRGVVFHDPDIAPRLRIAKGKSHE